MKRPPIYRYALQLTLADLAARDASLAPLTLDAALADLRWGVVLRAYARKFAHHRQSQPDHLVLAANRGSGLTQHI